MIGKPAGTEAGRFFRRSARLGFGRLCRAPEESAGIVSAELFANVLVGEFEMTEWKAPEEYGSALTRAQRSVRSALRNAYCAEPIDSIKNAAEQAEKRGDQFAKICLKELLAEALAELLLDVLSGAVTMVLECSNTMPSAGRPASDVSKPSRN